MEKIIIQKPVFYKESTQSTLYQLLSFEPSIDNDGKWYVQNVVRGCESPSLTELDFTKLSFNIERFNTTKFDQDFIGETVEAIDVINYFQSIGITAFDSIFNGNEPTHVVPEYVQKASVDIPDRHIVFA